ncbi:hypothetical protein ACWGKU_25835 [Kitasatospora sp. NPDC054768]
MLDTSTPSPSTPYSPTVLRTGLLNDVTAWLDSFLAAAQAVAVGSEGAAGLLQDSVGALIGLREETGAMFQRPQLARARAVRRVVETMEQILRTFLGAISASSPLAAQTLASQAQAQLDGATEVLGEISWLARATNQLDSASDPEDVADVLLQQALIFHSSADLVELDAAGRDELESLLGVRGSNGCGLTFAMYDVLARTACDRQRFIQLMTQAYSFLNAHASGVRALVADGVFEEDVRAAHLEVFDSCTRITSAVQQAQVTRQAGRALIDTAAALVEGPGRAMAALMLLAGGYKSKPYGKLRYDDATATIQAARQRPELAALFQGLDGDLRNARAHASVRYSEDRIAIDLRSAQRSLTWEEVVDTILTAQEGMLAMHVALTVVLSEHGIQNFGSPDIYRDCGMTPRRVVKILVENIGCSDLQVEADGPHWRLDGRMTDDTRTLSFLVTALLPLLPQSATTLSLTGRYADGAHTAAGPLEPWRAFTSLPADSEAYVTGMIRAQLLWSYDGDQYFPGPPLRRWASQQAAEAVDRLAPEAVRRLRELQALAALAEDTALREALAAAIRTVRLGRPDTSDKVAIENLRTWRSRPVAFPRR